MTNKHVCVHASVCTPMCLLLQTQSLVHNRKQWRAVHHFGAPDATRIPTALPIFSFPLKYTLTLPCFFAIVILNGCQKCKHSVNAHTRAFVIYLH